MFLASSLSLNLSSAFQILICAGLAVLLLPPKWPVVRIVAGALLAVYTIILLFQCLSGSASA